MCSSFLRLFTLFPAVAGLVGCCGSDKGHVAKLEADLQAAQVEIGRLKAQEPKEMVDFAGKWDGRYLDSLGGKGQGVYEFGEEKDGRLTVKVSWGQDQTMALTGERLGSDAMRLTGTSAGISYRYIGDVEKSGLLLHYNAEEGNSGKSHFGESRLTRQTK
jgi:hypothetical protein